MATTTAELGRKDIIVPPRRYEVKYIWVLDTKTNLPVRVRRKVFIS